MGWPVSRTSLRRSLLGEWAMDFVLAHESMIGQRDLVRVGWFRQGRTSTKRLTWMETFMDCAVGKQTNAY